MDNIKKVELKHLFEIFLASINAKSPLVKTRVGLRTSSSSKDYELVLKNRTIIQRVSKPYLDGDRYFNDIEIKTIRIVEDSGSVYLKNEDGTNAMSLTSKHNILRLA